MAFHVEIRRSYRFACEFNLTRETLDERVIAPWASGDPFELGEAEWDPRESRLTVLEGRELDVSELAFGQGWNSARRVGADVTAQVLDRGPGGHPARASAGSVAIVGDDAATEAMSGFLGALGLRTVAWAAVRAELLALAVPGPPPEPAPLGATAVVVVLSPFPPDPQEAALDTGLALGALPGRTILTQLGDATSLSTPGTVGVIRLDVPGPAPLHALAQRLRAVGCPVRPAEGWDGEQRFSS